MAFDCNFQSKGNKRRNVRLHCFPINNRRRKEWENACGRIKLPKEPLFFLSTLALMPLNLLVDHSYWKSLQTAKTRNIRCYLLGCKHADANHVARLLEEFLSTDFPPYLWLLHSSWGKIHGTVFGLNLQYTFIHCQLRFFSSCGHHISILFSE